MLHPRLVHCQSRGVVTPHSMVGINLSDVSSNLMVGEALAYVQGLPKGQRGRRCAVYKLPGCQRKLWWPFSFIVSARTGGHAFTQRRHDEGSSRMETDYNFWKDLLDTYQSLTDWVKALWLIIPPVFVLGLVALLCHHRRETKRLEQNQAGPLVYEIYPDENGDFKEYAQRDWQERPVRLTRQTDRQSSLAIPDRIEDRNQPRSGF